MGTANNLYAIGLGSNRRHGRFGNPTGVVTAAAQAIAAHGKLVALSPILATIPVGPSSRRFANAAVLLESALSPPDLLAALKQIERAFGRRGGQRWGARVIDLDILLWSGGAWRGRGLAVPHVALARRAFALRPLVTIAPNWTLPGTSLTNRHLLARLTKGAPVHRDRSRSGP